jgi:glycosyltransferase involved in cell wall biosynthesis
MSTPRVTIATPVYNGERYLAGALDSVLSQSFGDFELLIHDNASNDSTQQICEQFAARDKRIRYVRNATNLGAVTNFNLGAQNARGDYFRWHCYDDLMKPGCLQAAVDDLHANPRLAVSHCLTELIDEAGDFVEMFEVERKLDDPRAHMRFWSMLWTKSFPPIFGLMRTDLVRKTRLFGPYVGADRYFLAELLLLGGLHYVREPLFAIRVHPAAYRVQGATAEVRRQWYVPSGRRMPTFMQMPISSWAFAETIRHADAPSAQKLLCYAHLGAWMAHGAWGIVARRFPKLIGKLQRRSSPS